MNEQQFQDIMNSMERTERSIMGVKGLEYTQGDLETDRLANFYRIAKEIDQDPKIVCYIYLKKHLDSIACYMKNNKEFSEEKIEGRISDARNYLVLLNAIIQEQKKQNELKVQDLG